MSKVATPPAVQPRKPMNISEERIAMRAYEKWCERGCMHGHDVEDWYEAEAELRREQTHSGPAGQRR
jgi:Protein of unknown function (DUF2934)